MSMTFEQRKAANASIVRKENGKLYAGSPMYYYCIACGAEMALPETHIEFAPQHCDACINEGRGDIAAELRAIRTWLAHLTIIVMGWNK